MFEINFTMVEKLPENTGRFCPEKNLKPVGNVEMTTAANAEKGSLIKLKLVIISLNLLITPFQCWGAQKYFLNTLHSRWQQN